MVSAEPVSSLLLDERNPRFSEQVNGQDEAITAILVGAPQKLLALAQDIATEGALNPTELPVVVEEDGELIVIEGNRRLAALKLLRNPELSAAASAIGTEDFVKRFSTLQRIGVGPDTIEVYQAESREAARHWMELRHTGENDGVGVLGWQSWQTNNYKRRRGSQADRATLFCEAVMIDAPANAELLSDVASVRRGRLTTLGRLVADPAVRSDFGIVFSGDEVLFEYLPEDLISGFERIFTDLAAGTSGTTVTDIKTKDQRHKYVSERSDVLPDRARKLAEPRHPGEFPAGHTEEEKEESGSTSCHDKNSSPVSSSRDDEKPSEDGATTSSNSGAPASSGASATKKTPPLENVIFKTLKLPAVNVRIRELLRMAQRININDAPPVCGILVRVLLELVLTEAIECGAIPGKESDNLKKKARAGLLVIDPDCENPMKRDKTLEMAWIKTQDGDSVAVQALNAFVHNVHGQAAPIEVRALSLAFRPLLEKLNDLIASKARTK